MSRLRRAIIELPLHELADLLELRATEVIDVKTDHMRATIRILIARDDLDRVPQGVEPPIIDVDDLAHRDHNTRPITGTYETMASRANDDDAYRDGLLDAARIARAQGTNPSLPPCPSQMAATYIESVANGDTP